MASVAETTNGGTVAIIPAGGLGRRFGPGQAKQFVTLVGWPVLAHTLSRFDQTTAVDRIILVVPRGQVKEVDREIVEAYGFSKVSRVVVGGESRQDSVAAGFMALEDEVDLVVIHDAVRPLVRCRTIEAVVDAARETGAAIAAVPVTDTLKRVENGVIQGGIDRRLVWQAQTPQAFRRDIYGEALARARADNYVGTDDAALVERLGYPVQVVQGGLENIKITMPEDLVLAETMMTYGCKEKGMRIGMGFDLHRLTPGRKLVLGGLEIPFDRGLEGHSDADALIHALIDAMFGAAGLGDIGRHFPRFRPGLGRCLESEAFEADPGQDNGSRVRAVQRRLDPDCRSAQDQGAGRGDGPPHGRGLGRGPGTDKHQGHNGRAFGADRPAGRPGRHRRGHDGAADRLIRQPIQTEVFVQGRGERRFATAVISKHISRIANRARQRDWAKRAICKGCCK